MYTNILLLLEALKQKKYILYTDYNILDSHLNEFFKNHKNLADIHRIKSYLASVNHYNENYDDVFQKFTSLKLF